MIKNIILSLKAKMLALKLKNCKKVYLVARELLVKKMKLFWIFFSFIYIYSKEKEHF